jgi:hypothetical protein
MLSKWIDRGFSETRRARDTFSLLSTFSRARTTSFGEGRSLRRFYALCLVTSSFRIFPESSSTTRCWSSFNRGLARSYLQWVQCRPGTETLDSGPNRILHQPPAISLKQAKKSRQDSSDPGSNVLFGRGFAIES